MARLASRYSSSCSGSPSPKYYSLVLKPWSSLGMWTAAKSLAFPEHMFCAWQWARSWGEGGKLDLIPVPKMPQSCRRALSINNANTACSGTVLHRITGGLHCWKGSYIEEDMQGCFLQTCCERLKCTKADMREQYHNLGGSPFSARYSAYHRGDKNLSGRYREIPQPPNFPSLWPISPDLKGGEGH